MNRRDFLRSAGIASASLALPGTRRLFAESAVPGHWRTFEVTTRVEVLTSSAATRVWLPAALIGETPFQRTLANRFHAEGGVAKIIESKTNAFGIVAAEFPAGVKPVLTLTSRIATMTYAVDLAATAKPPGVDWGELRYCLRATTMRHQRQRNNVREHSRTKLPEAPIPISRRPARSTIGSSTIRPGTRRTRGCGDAATFASCRGQRAWAGSTLFSGALFVGLARASGLPALRVIFTASASGKSKSSDT